MKLNVWLRCTDGHVVGKYSIYNTKTKKVILTHDVTFIQKYFADWNAKYEEPRVNATPKYILADSDEDDNNTPDILPVSSDP